MQESGASAKQVAQFVGTSTDREQEYLIQAENWDAWEVFTRCQFPIAGMGLSGAVNGHIPRMEVLQLIDLCEVPEDRKRDVMDQVLVLEAEALRILNKR